MTHLRKANRDLIKEINRNIVLNLIKSRGPISRTDIARLSGLSLATVSGIAADFIESGLVREMGEGESTGGRKPVFLRLNHQAGFVVGVKLMEQAITSALTDLDAKVLYHRVTSLQDQHDVQAVQGIIIAAVEATIAESRVDRARVLGIGIGMAGVVDGQVGFCRYSPFFGWRDVEVARPIADHFGLPVYLENDVNTLTIAEQWFGYGNGVDHFVVVTVGRGIGAGIVVNGQFYRGALGGAGEFGHITLQENGPPCDCGKRGCLEALASDPAVVRQARAAIALGERTTLAEAEPLTLEAIVAAAEAEDKLARRLLADSGRWLGMGIATLVNILNPQLIIVGGEGVQAGEWRFGPMREAVQAHAFNGLADDLEIVIEPSGDETWARGAACVVLGELFKSPVHKGEEVDLMAVMA
ncbi:MAG: ROK family transcriptional regulator [Anaerolineae bacterium]|nr:ROK family transcriptional regulator [Anaerolineae bacterium]MDH7474623.1 ROK family transcriptional regulator [Anaerolineae bacterium]